jgi:hypothetical protein
MALATRTTPKAKATKRARLIAQDSMIVQGAQLLAMNAGQCLHVLFQGFQLRLRRGETILTPIQEIIGNP